MDYRQMALELLCAARPRERRRPLSELDRQEQVQAATLRYLIEHGSVATPAQREELLEYLMKLLELLGPEDAEHLMRIARKIQNADMTPTFGCCTTERKGT